MPVVKKTQKNPHGLSPKQDLVIKDVVKTIKDGGKFNMVASTKKFYDVKNHNTAKSMTSQNYAKSNFRAALVEELENNKIIGSGSKLSNRLQEGLDATKLNKDDLVVDYDARLRYVQEISKIIGLYAPEVRKTMNLNLDMTEEDLDRKITELQAQLNVNL